MLLRSGLQAKYADRLQILEQGLGSVQQSVDDRSRHFIKNFDEVLETFNRTRVCKSRECDQIISLNCYITRQQRVDLNVPEYHLRCARCKCRQ